jgi:CheY-like chemotaxis protein
MTRILLVDDSPHAQRMGERILADEGYEVVTVSNADSALIRLEDVDPDIVIADTVMPGRTGYDICQYIKMSPRHRHVRVVLTAGVLETLDQERSRQVEADSVLMKPFEATVLLGAVKPLGEAAAADRESRASDAPKVAGKEEAKTAVAPFIAVVDEEQVRAAVTVALDASMAAMVDEITARVLAALASKKPEPAPAPMPTPSLVDTPASIAPAPIAPAIASRPPIPTPPPEPTPVPVKVEPVRRVSPVRLRSSSILGLDVGPIGPPDSES